MKSINLNKNISQHHTKQKSVVPTHKRKITFTEDLFSDSPGNQNTLCPFDSKPIFETKTVR